MESLPAAQELSPLKPDAEAVSRIFGNILLAFWRVPYFSAGPFLIILVPLVRGGLCDHFKANYIKIGPRSSEISSIKHWKIHIFLCVYLLRNTLQCVS